MGKVLHETEKVAVKTAAVDVGIRNLVMLLNSFPDVETLFSCQGDSIQKQKEIIKAGDQEHPSAAAYVTFSCSSDEQLKVILNCVSEFRSYLAGKIYQKERAKNPSGTLKIESDLAFLDFHVDYDEDIGRVRYSFYMGDTSYPNEIVKYYKDIYRIEKMREVFHNMPEVETEEA